MSPELKQFYKDLHQWIEDGLPGHPIFEQDYGVCEALCCWAADLELCPEVLIVELESSFKDMGLDTRFPFDEDFYSFKGRPKYSNKARLEWIRNHATED